MEPYIKTHSYVDVIPAKLHELKKYDIILFWDKETSYFICHFLVSQDDKYFYTKCLKHKRYDPPNPNLYFFGKVTNIKFGLLQKILLRLFW